MTSLLFNYLFESSVCLMLFLVIYKLLISNLTHFSLMRMYLLVSLGISIVLPLINIPIQWHLPFISNESIANTILLQKNLAESIDVNLIKTNTSHENFSLSLQFLVLFSLLAIYAAGFAYKAYVFVRNLKFIHSYIKQNVKEKKDQYWIVKIENQVPAFSFFNYIFINYKYKNISSDDIHTIMNHEMVHAKQLHSLDILFVEFVGIVFWFNPFVNYLRISLQEIHEFIVDEEIAKNSQQKKAYAQLLLSLASDTKIFSLAASFTGKHIKRRILMIAKPRTSPILKLVFMIIAPLTLVMLLSFSSINNPNLKDETNLNTQTTDVQKQKLGKLNWSGNTVYNEETLSKALNLKSGDYFSLEDLEMRLYPGDVSNLYMNNGYLFFNLEYSISDPINNVSDLSISIVEGKQAKIGNVTIKGNENVSTIDILNKILVKPGDLFSKEKIINSVREIAMMDKFDPEKISPNVMPNPEKITNGFMEVNIEFELTENIKK